MDKLKLSELVELESVLHKRRAREELQSLCNYREAQPDLNKEFDFDTAKAYLSRRGYTNSEISNALENFKKLDFPGRIKKERLTVVWSHVETRRYGICGTNDPYQSIQSILGDVAENRDIWQYVNLIFEDQYVLFPLEKTGYLALKALENHVMNCQLPIEDIISGSFCVNILLPPKGYSPIFHGYSREILTGFHKPIDLYKTKADSAKKRKK